MTTTTTSPQMSRYMTYNNSANRQSSSNNNNNSASFYFYAAESQKQQQQQKHNKHKVDNCDGDGVDYDAADEVDLLDNDYIMLPATKRPPLDTPVSQLLTKEDSNLLLATATQTPRRPFIPKSSSYDASSTAAALQLPKEPKTEPVERLYDSDESSDCEYSLMLKNNNNNNNNNSSSSNSNQKFRSHLEYTQVNGGNHTTKTHTKSASLSMSTSASGDYLLNGNVGSTSILLGSPTSSTASSSQASSRRGTRTPLTSLARTRSSCCFRLYALLTRNWYLSYLLPLCILVALIFVAYLTRGYATRLLFWIEDQNPWLTFALYLVLLVVVSFPVVVGYFLLLVTAGYLFGSVKGFGTVVLGANLGIAIAHVTIRSLRHRIPMQKLIKNETGRAILRVISGPRAFKVVLFTRLTPLPFGIQNAIFGVSSINPYIYHSATFLGLLPAQAINVYLGSTLRSMHEVLNNHDTQVTGYISLIVEVITGVALMLWVVQKARKELSETLISDISSEGKLLDIQV